MHDSSKGNATNNMFPFPLLPDMDSVKYYRQAIQVAIHHFYIVDEIGDVSKYLDMINLIKTAEQHDTIFIYLNTPGGNLHTTIQIVSAMRQSQATVITCLEGEVASAGTLIFLAGHKHVVNPFCTFMIHNYSHWVGGKGNEVALRVRYSEQYFKKLATSFYGGFLTDDELDSVVNGKDLWMDSDEVMSRLSKDKSASSMAELMNDMSALPEAQDEVGDALIAALRASLEANGVGLDDAEEVAEAAAPAPKPKKKPAKKKKEA